MGEGCLAQMAFKSSWPTVCDCSYRGRVCALAQLLAGPALTLHFYRYMKRRCHFLDNCPSFNYNSGVGELQVDESGKKTPTNTKQLGSTLMQTMLMEVGDFCDPKIKENWSLKPHQQVAIRNLLPFINYFFCSLFTISKTAVELLGWSPFMLTTLMCLTERNSLKSESKFHQ